MKRCEADFSEEYKKQLENELLSKNIIKFARKFKMGIYCVASVEGQYDLLKEDFERVFPNLNFEDEWKKVTYEDDEKFSVTAYDEIIALGLYNEN